jgi:hypothetical protein
MTGIKTAKRSLMGSDGGRKAVSRRPMAFTRGSGRKPSSNSLLSVVYSAGWMRSSRRSWVHCSTSPRLLKVLPLHPVNLVIYRSMLLAPTGGS